MLRGRLILTASLFTLALTCWLVEPRSAAQPPTDPDETLLRNAGLPIDGPGLLDFFRKRSLKVADRQILEDLVGKLDSTAFKVREAAVKELIVRGRLALPFLKKAVKTGSLEMVRRATDCIKKIEGGPGPEQPAAAARLLVLRQPKEAVEVLLDYIPFADEEWLADEILNALGILAQRQGKMDYLLATLKDPQPERRGVAAYVLAQRGSLAQREAVRRLLLDADAGVRVRAASGLIGKHALQNVTVNATADEATLRNAGIGTGANGLLEFFQKRTLDEKAQEHLKQLIAQLGSRSWSAREKATKELIARGVPAVPFLKAAVEDSDLEMVRRATVCLEKIKLGPGPGLPVAAARLLVRAAGSSDIPPARAIQTLLTYVPFADDETVEDEVLTALSVLSVRDTKVDPLFVSALHDALPPRRGAAAFVLGRSGTQEQCQAVQRLLGDPVLRVRLRAAQGLVAARDKTAVPALIDLLGKAPETWVWRVEELLNRIAADKAPQPAMDDKSGDLRKRTVTAWNDWWRGHGSQVDLTRVLLNEQRLGLITIVEYDSNFGNRQGQVSEVGRDGKERWTVKNLMGAMDAQVLPNNRILVAENNVGRVSERDLTTGNILWQHSVPNPVTCQRLPNGNTFIAYYNGFRELSPTREVVFTHALTPNFFIFSAKKLRSGQIVCMTSQGILIEIDPATKQQT
ncbi:MAG TPA: HEAT repeat domain-containing protein, partial [Gemmataceae bacterium]|nr:HEAT repeat domain-containing protein [Gemmataceae bacterium]